MNAPTDLTTLAGDLEIPADFISQFPKIEPAIDINPEKMAMRIEALETRVAILEEICKSKKA